MKRFFLLLAFPVVCLAADSTVADTLLNLTGGPATCTLTITGQAMSATGRTIITSRKSVVANPSFSVVLIPNDTAVPSGTSYHVDYSCSSIRSFSETWVVPTSASPLGIQAVRVNLPPPSPGVSFNPSQLAQGGATIGQTLTWSGVVWAPANGSGGINGPGSSLVGSVPQWSNTLGSTVSGGLGVVTLVGAPGSNSNLATEAAIRAAIVAATSGVSGPGTSIAGYVPLWGNTLGTSLTAGLSVTVTPGANAIPESDTNGFLAAGWLPAFSGDITTSAGSTVAAVTKINGTLLSGLATGLLKNTTGTGVPVIASSADVLATCPSCVTTAGTTDGRLIKGAGSQGIQGADLSGDALTSGTTTVTNTGLNGVQLSSLATGLLKNTTGTGVPSIATSADILTTCPTCVTSIAALPAGQLVAGADLQATQPANLTGDAITSGSTAVTVQGLNGTLLSGLTTGLLKVTTATGAISTAAAGTDYVGVATGVQNNQANTYTTGLQHMGLADLLLPVHSSDPGTCTAGQIEFNSVSTAGKICTATNTWTTIGVSSGTVTGPGSSTNLNVPQWSGTGGTALSTGLGVVTTVGSPGSDSNLATEAAVRAAIAAGTSGVTGPGTTVVGVVPLWGDVTGTSLSAGVAVSATAAVSTIVKSDGGGKIAAGWLPNPSASTLGGIQSFAAVTNQWIKSISTSGVPASTRPACPDLSDAASSCSTDTTVATNIASDTLNAARLPAVTVQTGQANTYTTGLQDFSNNAVNLRLPNHSTDPATCSVGQIEFNTVGAIGKLCPTTNTWVGIGTVSSFSVSAIPSWLTAAVATPTSTPALSITATAAQTANRFIATPDGTTGAVGLRAIVTGDIPLLTAAQMPAFSGDISTSSGTTATTLAPSGASNGTYTKVTVNTKGLVTSGTTLLFADVPSTAAATPSTIASRDSNGDVAFHQVIADSFLSSNTGATLWQFKEGAAPPPPSGGYTKNFYQDSTTHHLTAQYTDGTTKDLETAGSGSGTVTNTLGNLTLNAIVLGNGTVDAKVLASLGTTTTVLHGNASGPPSFGSLALAADVSGILPIVNGGTGTASTLTGIIRGNSSAMTGTELSGDAVTSGSNAVLVKQIHDNVTALVFANSPYSITTTDSYVSCDATAGAIVIALPAASGSGREITVKKIDSSANACTPTRNGTNLIDGAVTVSLTSQYAAAKLIDRVTGTWDRIHVSQLVGDVSGPSTANLVTVTHLAAALPIVQGGTGVTTAAAAATALLPVATRQGDVIYWTGSSWDNLPGNNSGTNFLQENASGVPSWVPAVGTGTVTSIATAGPITGGTITSTGTIDCPSCVRATSPGAGIAHFAGSTQTVTSSLVVAADTDNSVAHTGVDINTSHQVTVTHLASALPVNQGGTGSTSTLTGLMRGNASAMTASELSGDVTTSGSNGVTLATVNSVSGSCGDATHVCVFTTNPKGLVTTQQAISITAGGGSGTVTNTLGNLTLNAIVLGNGTVDAKVLASLGTTTTLLHGGAGAPTWAGVALAADVTGTLPIANGGTGTASTLTGLLRGSGSAMTAAELSGDVSTSGSNAVTVTKVNGLTVPVSAPVLATNASGQLVAVNYPGRPATVAKSFTAGCSVGASNIRQSGAVDNNTALGGSGTCHNPDSTHPVPYWSLTTGTGASAIAGQSGDPIWRRGTVDNAIHFELYSAISTISLAAEQWVFGLTDQTTAVQTATPTVNSANYFVIGFNVATDATHYFCSSNNANASAPAASVTSVVADTNMHLFTMDESAANVIFKVDGVTACTLTTLPGTSVLMRFMHNSNNLTSGFSITHNFGTLEIDGANN